MGGLSKGDPAVSTRSIHRLLVFVFAVVISAFAMALFIHVAMGSYRTRGIRVASRAELARMPFDCRAADAIQFYGMLGSPDWPDRVEVRAYTDGRIQVRPCFGDGAGAPWFESTFDTQSGRFDTGRWSVCMIFREATRIRGVVRGPALVDGVPSIYIDAWAWTDQGEKLRPEWRRVRHWQGVLKAAGW
jgi:hypothetical protein